MKNEAIEVSASEDTGLRCANPTYAVDWPILPLEECLDALIDYRGKTPEKTNAGIPLVTAKIIKGGRIEKASEFISKDGYDAWMRRGIPQAGDVVMTTEAPLGEVAQLGKEKIALAQRVVTLRGKLGLLDSTYLLYLLQTEEMQKQLKARASGTTVLGIKQSELRKISVTLPPIDLQRSSASVLAAIDARIDILRETNATLEAIAQALFKSWFVDFDPVRAKQQGREPEGAVQECTSAAEGRMPVVALDTETAALFPDSFEELELGLVPSGWRNLAFTDTVKVIGGGTPKTSMPEYWDGDIPWFSVVDAPATTDVFVIDTTKHISVQGLNNSSTKLLPEGTTIISARGTVGRLALVGREMAMNQSCYGLRGKADDAYFTYFSTYRLVESLKQRSHGSVFDTITTETMKGVFVIYPDTKVIHAFETVLNPVMNRIKANLEQAQTLTALRDTLLPRLISGQLRLPDAEALAEEAGA
ncbi:type I restriction enzyme S subunit [Methylobacter tundripaludum]|uniref:Type I restriction enzyme S subunit n=1 Tax=Methylobacter tundripaludum TaxID=173365 RepID=A0A2S6GZY2_9GAMM|nr:restriction endonuclease subunit S [Methylobacter tundripaludum]PPK70794.1 type I restriction enzyme S subunit [Methylobacter tundripaludum]